MGKNYFEFTKTELKYLSKRLLEATEVRCNEKGKKIPIPKETYRKWGITTKTYPNTDEGSFIVQYRPYNTDDISANHVYKKLSEKSSRIKISVFEDFAKYCGVNEDIFLEEISEKIEEKNIKSANLKFNKLVNTQWELFIYNYKIRATDTPGIVRLILRINKKKKNNNINVVLENVEGENSFTGEIINNEYNNNILFLSLNTEDKSKNLTIIFNVSASFEPKNNIFLGQYIDNEEANEIISGTVLLKRIDDPGSDILPKRFKLGTKDIDDIDETIIEFLKYKILNFTKTPTAKYNLADLKAWIDDERKNEFYKNLISYFDANLGDDKYDIFISAPVTSLSKTRSNEFLNEMENMIDYLSENCGLNNIYYYPLIKQESNPKINLLAHEIDKIRKSKIFTFIYPQKVASSALIELGMVLGLNKPVYIFYKAKDDLPIIIQKYADQEFSQIHWHEYKSLMEIPDILYDYFQNKL